MADIPDDGRPARRNAARLAGVAAALWLASAGTTGPGVMGVAAAEAVLPTAAAVETAPEVVVSAPTASGAFGEPVVFRAIIEAPEPPLRVELITNDPGSTASHVRFARVTPAGEGTWEATVTDGSHIVPNTPIEHRFRAVMPDGSVTGPAAVHRVVDERLEWRSLSGERVTIHWHEGSEDFARRALAIGEEAIDEAAALLGVEDVAPVDFIVYADGDAFRAALGPGTREQVGGQANTGIRTLFGLIAPTQVGSDWVAELVAHELTHLVFDEAVANPYHYPPRWLNEGLAVYLSVGYRDGDRAQVAGAARAGTLMPLEALVEQFPTSPRAFSLAYAASVSAVDLFVERYGRDRLVDLITSYAAGVSDDEAFLAATGEDVRAFDEAWLASLGLERPEPLGPRPAPPGPTPAVWHEDPDPLLP